MDRCQCRPDFQRNLGAIGPYKFQGIYEYGPMPWCLVFKQNLNGLRALKVRQGFFPETGIGPWMALPSTKSE